MTIRIIGRTLFEEVSCGFKVIDYQNIDSKGSQKDKIACQELHLAPAFNQMRHTGNLTISLCHFKICNAFIFSWKIKYVANERQWFRARREWQIMRINTTTHVEFPQQMNQ